MINQETAALWKEFVQNGNEIDPSKIRPQILASWNRCRQLGVNPYEYGCTYVSPDELADRKKKNQTLLNVAMPYLHKLYKIIKGSGSSLTITDEDGVILDIFSDPEMKAMPNFPEPGTIHLEKNIGTSGIGTALALGEPVQIRAEEHWLLENQSWVCNSSPIRRMNQIIGCLNLSCPVGKAHEHSLGMIVASVTAIEREIEMTVLLGEKKKLVRLHESILELLDTGIVVINLKGCITQINQRALQIFQTASDWKDRDVKDLILCRFDFTNTAIPENDLVDQDIAVNINGKYSYLNFSTAVFGSATESDGIVIRIREPAVVRRMVNKAAGSQAVYTFSDIIGVAASLQPPLKIARLAAKNLTNVLILGESGTGKELIAQAIHNGSDRKNEPFVALNCGALSRELIQSELFGYESGSFTGAKKSGNPGKFELADGGTLFLDEIGELPLDTQTNLLRVLQSGEVLRIGAKNPNTVNVRIIAATNRDLEEAVKQRSFRNDLYYRLNVLSLTLPPLRERREDIPVLTRHFIDKFKTKTENHCDGLSADVQKLFQDYFWPGNIRELENTIERALMITETNEIEAQDLPSSLLENPNNMQSLSNPITPVRHAHSSNIKDLEREYLKEKLIQCHGNLRMVSTQLGLSRGTIYNKMKKYGLFIEDFR